MKRLLLTIAALVAVGSAAHAAGLTGYACQGWGLTWLAGPSVCGSAPAPSANLRITNTGDFRVTNTGDNRLVAP